ncbi:MAG: hypothetical protein LBC98_09895 [Prevotellaceae bacterium]|nr:hypothetical protein [Prevotellaceae bacterium]
MSKNVPIKDPEFDSYQDKLVKVSHEKASTWRLDDEWIVSDVMPDKAEWDASWADYKDPNTRTTVITARKRNARKNYEPKIGILTQMLEINPRISDAELLQIGIERPSKIKHKSVPPTTIPDCSIDIPMIRTLTINFHDHGTKSRAKPRGYHGVEIRWGVLDAFPASVNELTESKLYTSSPATLNFKDNERGRTVWFCARWENNVGEPGPWSTIQSTIVP